MTTGAEDLRPIGTVRSPLRDPGQAPKQGDEGAPDAWVDLREDLTPGLLGLRPGDRILLITWLHRANRDTLQVRPRGDPARQRTGVFATRSPDRPNPIGLHEVVIRRIEGHRLEVGPLEAIDGTPVLDIKPTLSPIALR